MVRKTRKSAPYFFRRIWSPFSSGISAVGNTADIALKAADSTGYTVARHLNDAVGGLVGPKRGGKKSRRTMRKSRKASRKSRKASRKSKNARRH